MPGDHYENVAQVYEDAFFYGDPRYNAWLADRVAAELATARPVQEDGWQPWLVDLGGGTGAFTALLCNRLAAAPLDTGETAAQAGEGPALRNDGGACNSGGSGGGGGGGSGGGGGGGPPMFLRALCVDNSRDMVMQALRHPCLEPLLMGAVEFSRLPPPTPFKDGGRETLDSGTTHCVSSGGGIGGPVRYHRALLKEVVHHIPNEQVGPMYRGLAHQLLPGGCILTITRPQEVDYPLFKAARQVWRDNQPAAELYLGAMRDAGLQVKEQVQRYRVRIPLSAWTSMMRSRFWSTFSAMSDEQLEAGIAEVEHLVAAAAADGGYASAAAVDDVTPAGEAGIAGAGEQEAAGAAAGGGAGVPGTAAASSMYVEFEDRLLFLVGCKPADATDADAADGCGFTTANGGGYFAAAAAVGTANGDNHTAAAAAAAAGTADGGGKYTAAAAGDDDAAVGERGGGEARLGGGGQAAGGAAAAAGGDGTARSADGGGDTHAPASQQQQQQQQQQQPSPAGHYHNQQQQQPSPAGHYHNQQQQQQSPPSPSPASLAHLALRFRSQGHAGPLRVLSADEAGEAYRHLLRYERQLGGTISGDWRYKAHLLLPWMWRLLHHPSIVRAACAALGCSNVLCWSTDIFVKDPGSSAFVSWHQDSTYVGLDPPDALTVWLALTPSTAANGCLRFLACAPHLQGQLPHWDTYAPGNMLLKGQAIEGLEGREGEQQQEEGQAMELLPGEASLHHIRAVHCSRAAQEGSGRRVGIAIRYMAAHVVQALEPRDSVTPVAGLDTFGMYTHEREPQEEMGEAELQEHARAVQRVYPDGYKQRQ